MEDEEIYNHYNQEFENSSKHADNNNIMQGGSPEIHNNLKVIILT
jgi:hypothetical protein